MRIAVRSFGCAENQAEGEMIQGLLAEAHDLVGEEQADAVVLNICTVKGNTSTLREVRAIRDAFPEKKMVITGCVPQDIIASIQKISPNASFIGTHHIREIPQALLRTTPIVNVALEKTQKINLPRIRKNPAIGIIPISQGCLDACGFCSTRLVKGLLHSYPEEAIINEVRTAVKSGCKEIWLTGQDTACYGFEHKTNLARLITKVTQVPGDFRIRVGMGNPRHIPRYQQELIEAFDNPRVFSFLHLPLQSGSNQILKLMRRGHDVQTVEKVLAAFRKRFPQMTFSTDVIVGFPGETEQEFCETLAMLRKLRFDIVNLARYAPRPNTPAYQLQDTPGSVKKQRSQRASKIIQDVALKNNRAWIGWSGSVVVTEPGSRGGVVARNFAYKPVVIREQHPLGSAVRVIITRVTPLCLYGEVCSFTGSSDNNTLMPCAQSVRKLVLRR